MLTPLLVRLSSDTYGEEVTSSAWLRRTEVLFVAVSVPLVVLGAIVGPRVLEVVFSNVLLDDWAVSALATATILVLLLATTTQQFLWSITRFSAVAKSWIVAAVAFVVLVPFAVGDLTTLLIAMVIAGSAAATLQSVAARRS